MSVPTHSDESELPPTVVAERRAYRCEWCGRPIDATVATRDLATDAGRRTHRYLPKCYRACDDVCRARTVKFVRRHMALGPLLWSLTVLSFFIGLVGLGATLPPPMHLLALEPDDLILLLGALGLLGLATGTLVAVLPYTFIARRPEGDPPVVPLRRACLYNRVLGAIMALFSAVVVIRVSLWL